MERKEKRGNHRPQIEVCFVRNLESLHNDELRLVMRDKLAPLVVGGEDSLQSDAYAAVRLAHSDEALAVMFEVEAAHCVGTMSFALKWAAGECGVELSSDGEKAWMSGVSDQEALHHFGAADESRWWHIAVLPLAAINMCNNAKDVDADFMVSAVDSSDAESHTYGDLKLHCAADLV